MTKLTLFINNQVAYECDRDMDFTSEQLMFLDKMDSDMDRGIKIQGKLIANPDEKQRATFVTMSLIRALQQDNNAATNSSCAYLVKRLPNVLEIRASDEENTIDIELVEEH